MSNNDLKNAKKEKKYEFYTLLTDIEKEISHYKEYFEDKIVFCNCDDPYESNFFKYFANNFNFLKLKKLIATCYSGSTMADTQLNFFNKKDNNKKRKAYKIEITEVKDENKDGAINLLDVEILIKNNKNVLTILNENGDFRSSECVDLLKESDIVVTNPPFGLFREYLAQLEKYKKDYIIIGNTNALTYKDIFKLFKNNRIRTGYTNFNVGMYFVVPETYTKYTKILNGQKLARVSSSCWFTNLPVKKHNDILPLYREYTPENYPKYDNYDAINVDTYTDIPKDYFGVMGVPVTFLDKYNPNQFEIIELGIVGSCNFSCNKKMEILDKNGNGTGKYTYNAKGTLYKIYNPKKDKKMPAFKDVKTGQLYSSIYARVLIRRKNEN